LQSKESWVGLLFGLEKYRDKQSEFMELVDAGQKLGTIRAINLLQKMFNYYCEVSMGFRTVAYDFATYVLIQAPELWNDQERKSGMPCLSDHWLEFNPGDEGLINEYDVCALTYHEYLHCFLEILFSTDWELETRQALAYGGFLFLEDSVNYETEEEISAAFKFEADYPEDEDYDDEDEL